MGAQVIHLLDHFRSPFAVAPLSLAQSFPLLSMFARGAPVYKYNLKGTFAATRKGKQVAGTHLIDSLQAQHLGINFEYQCWSIHIEYFWFRLNLSPQSFLDHSNL